MLVPGRLGGPVIAPLSALPFDWLRLIAGGAESPPAAGGADAGSLSSLGIGTSEGLEDALWAVPIRGADVGPGGPVPLIDLGGPVALGGGGVALGVGVFSAPPFLLIHLFNSGSYTKEDSSPSFARMGLFGCAPISVDSFLPPNQLPRPQPFFAGSANFERAARGTN
jgi:hypothetical protein